MPALKKPKLEGAMEAVPVPMSSIQETILSCWTTRGEDEFWNVYLVFDDGKELLCSRRDLALMSHYFAAMFRGEFAESIRTKIAIKDTESSAMEQMIESYYTWKVSIFLYACGPMRSGNVSCSLFRGCSPPLLRIRCPELE